MKTLIYFLIFIVLISVVVGDNVPGGGGGGAPTLISYTEDECQQRAYDICDKNVKAAIQQGKEERKKSENNIIVLVLLLSVLYFYYRWKQKKKLFGDNGYYGIKPSDKAEPITEPWIKEPIKEAQPFLGSSLFKKPKEETITKKKEEPKSEPIDPELFYKEM